MPPTRKTRPGAGPRRKKAASPPHTRSGKAYAAARPSSKKLVKAAAKKKPPPAKAATPARTPAAARSRVSTSPRPGGARRKAGKIADVSPSKTRSGKVYTSRKPVKRSPVSPKKSPKKSPAEPLGKRKKRREDDTQEKPEKKKLKRHNLHDAREIFGLILKADEALAKPSSSVWNDATFAAKEMQRVIDDVFGKPVHEDEDSGGASDSGARLDAWQAAAAVPLLRRRGELVIAPTGSGKTFVIANMVAMFLRKHVAGDILPNAPDVSRIILAVRSGKAQTESFDEICNSEVFRLALGTPRVSPDASSSAYVKKGEISTRHPVSIVSFAQLGNWFGRVNKAQLAGTLVILDEVHELANPKEAAGAWRKSIDALNDVLDERATQPYNQQFGFVGLTATPPTDNPQAMARLLTWFAPPGLKHPFNAAELSTKSDAAPPIPPPKPEDLKRCDKTASAETAPMPLQRLLGYNMFVYTVERNTNRFAMWSTSEPMIMLVQLDDAALGIEGRKTGWTEAALKHHIRVKKLGKAYADATYRLLKEDVKKTLVFLDGNKAVETYVIEMKRRLSGATVIQLTDKSLKRDIDAAKEDFDTGGSDTVLVATVKTFGTGISFQSNDASKRVGMGARRIIYTPASSAGKLVQTEGRAVRRGTHSGMEKSEREVDRIILLPVSGSLQGAVHPTVMAGVETALKAGKVEDPVTGELVPVDTERGEMLLEQLKAVERVKAQIGSPGGQRDSPAYRDAMENARRMHRYKQETNVVERLYNRFYEPEKRPVLISLSKYESVVDAAESLRGRKNRERLKKAGALEARGDQVRLGVGAASRTCEGVMLAQNLIGRWASESVLSAMFWASAGALALWSWRPLSLEKASAPGPTSMATSLAQDAVEYMKRVWEASKKQDKGEEATVVEEPRDEADANGKTLVKKKKAAPKGAPAQKKSPAKALAAPAKKAPAKKKRLVKGAPERVEPKSISTKRVPAKKRLVKGAPERVKRARFTDDTHSPKPSREKLHKQARQMKNAPSAKKAPQKVPAKASAKEAPPAKSKKAGATRS